MLRNPKKKNLILHVYLSIIIESKGKNNPGLIWIEKTTSNDTEKEFWVRQIRRQEFRQITLVISSENHSKHTKIILTKLIDLDNPFDANFESFMVN